MKIHITQTGFNTLYQLKSYMSNYLSEQQVAQLMRTLVTQTTDKLTDTPQRAVCPELSGIGIYDYLQLNLMKKYKVLYRYDNANEHLYIIAFMRQRQSAEKLLVDLALML